MQIEQQLLVRNSFEKVFAMADIAGGLFYSRLFVLKPRLKRLFSDIDTQRRVLTEAIRIIVLSMDNWNAIAPRLQELGLRHARFGIKPEDYAVVNQALIWMLEECLGKDFDEATRAAWQEFYQRVSIEMQAQGAFI